MLGLTTIILQFLVAGSLVLMFGNTAMTNYYLFLNPTMPSVSPWQGPTNEKS